jgi:hypothetical protein
MPGFMLFMGKRCVGGAIVRPLWCMLIGNAVQGVGCQQTARTGVRGEYGGADLHTRAHGGSLEGRLRQSDRGRRSPGPEAGQAGPTTALGQRCAYQDLSPSLSLVMNMQCFE